MEISDLEKAKARFEEMAKPCYSANTVEYLGKGIRDLVRLGKTTWKELGFTDKDIEKRIRQAKVRCAKEDFDLMLNPRYSAETVQKMADQIRHLVRTEQATWEELGCTEAEVGRRLAVAKERWVKR